MASKVLVQFAHPALQKSRVGAVLARAVSEIPGVTMRDLYELYPDALIDVEAEQRLLREHETVVFLHPFYWYSTPSLLKEWSDLVLEYGFAYGKDGHALGGKRWLQACTLGGGESAYGRDGQNHFTVRELLAPLEATARLCGMQFEDPFLVYGAGRLSREAIQSEASRFASRIEGYLR